ncbi:MAG: TIGR04282 family arsenosugar biosynthesis glycosyltransferase [Bryobacteraceae bacterium]
MPPVIILFAKAPVPGHVKTRLLPFLSPTEAASLHTAFVLDTIERLQLFTGALLELHTDINTDAWRAIGVSRRLQAEGDLASKMFHALQSALSQGHPRATIVGSDSPTLPGGYIRELMASSADVALGPTEDGGYYAISCARVDREMFRGVEWSGPDTLAQTVQAVQACGLSVETGRSWFDIDTPEDLRRLSESPELPPHTRSWFNAIRANCGRAAI